MPPFAVPSQRIHSPAHLSSLGDRSQCGIAHCCTADRVWASARALLAGHRRATPSGSAMSTTRPTARPSFRRRLWFSRLGRRAALRAPPTNRSRASPNIPGGVYSSSRAEATRRPGFRTQRMTLPPQPPPVLGRAACPLHAKAIVLLSRPHRGQNALIGRPRRSVTRRIPV